MRVLEFNAQAEALARDAELFQALRNAGKLDGGTVRYAEPFEHNGKWYLPFVDEVAEFVSESDIIILTIEEEQ